MTYRVSGLVAAGTAAINQSNQFAMVLFTISIDYHNNGNFVPRACYKTEQKAVTKANNLPWPSKVRKVTALQCVGIKSRNPEFNIVPQ